MKNVLWIYEVERDDFYNQVKEEHVVAENEMNS